MTAGQYGAYGTDYYAQPQQYSPSQVIVPKKPFPWVSTIIITVLVLSLVGGGLFYYLNFFLPESQLTFSVTPLSLTSNLAAGQSGNASLLVSNPTKKEILTSIDISGMPEWTTSDKSVLRILPGDSEEIVLTFSPPSSAKSTSGIIAFSGQDIVVTSTLNILPPPKMKLLLSKPSLIIDQGNKGNLLLTISNIGQSAASNISATISGINESFYSLDITSVNIPAGEQKAVPITFDIPINAESTNYETLVIVQGTGFKETLPFTLNINPAVGKLQLEPDSISGDKIPGQVEKITVSNTGNADLYNITFTATGSFGEISDFSAASIPKLSSGQSTEIGITLDGTNSTYTGSIQASAIDTHGVVQTQIITASILIK